jgi:hypothetical protein
MGGNFKMSSILVKFKKKNPFHWEKKNSAETICENNEITIDQSTELF